jgi:ATP-dependent Clp protease ATP-binding subunit ClpA
MPKKLENSKNVQTVLNDIATMAKRMRHEFYMPEHLLLALLAQQPFRTALSYSNANPAAL